MVKNLLNRFLENGGTQEEFWAGRRNALQQANNRSNRHKKIAAAARRDRISDLMEKGYNRFEAEEKLRLEEFEAIDASGINPAYKPCRRKHNSKFGLHETK